MIEVRTICFILILLLVTLIVYSLWSRRERKTRGGFEPIDKITAKVFKAINDSVNAGAEYIIEDDPQAEAVRKKIYKVINDWQETKKLSNTGMNLEVIRGNTINENPTSNAQNMSNIVPNDQPNLIRQIGNDVDDLIKRIDNKTAKMEEERSRFNQCWSDKGTTAVNTPVISTENVNIKELELEVKRAEIKLYNTIMNSKLEQYLSKEKSLSAENKDKELKEILNRAETIKEKLQALSGLEDINKDAEISKISATIDSLIDNLRKDEKNLANPENVNNMDQYIDGDESIGNNSTEIQQLRNDIQQLLIENMPEITNPQETIINCARNIVYFNSFINNLLNNSQQTENNEVDISRIEKIIEANSALVDSIEVAKRYIETFGNDQELATEINTLKSEINEALNGIGQRQRILEGIAHQMAAVVAEESKVQVQENINIDENNVNINTEAAEEKEEEEGENSIQELDLSNANIKQQRNIITQYLASLEAQINKTHEELDTKLGQNNFLDIDKHNDPEIDRLSKELNQLKTKKQEVENYLNKLIEQNNTENREATEENEGEEDGNVEANTIKNVLSDLFKARKEAYNKYNKLDRTNTDNNIIQARKYYANMYNKKNKGIKEAINFCKYQLQSSQIIGTQEEINNLKNLISDIEAQLAAQQQENDNYSTKGGVDMPPEKLKALVEALVHVHYVEGYIPEEIESDNTDKVFMVKCKRNYNKCNIYIIIDKGIIKMTANYKMICSSQLAISICSGGYGWVAYLIDSADESKNMNYRGYSSSFNNSSLRPNALNDVNQPSRFNTSRNPFADSSDAIIEQTHQASNRHNPVPYSIQTKHQSNDKNMKLPNIPAQHNIYDTVIAPETHDQLSITNIPVIKNTSQINDNTNVNNNMTNNINDNKNNGAFDFNFNFNTHEKMDVSEGSEDDE